MTKMAFDSQNCRGAESGTTGIHYSSDRKGFIDVTDSRDIKSFQQNGYTLVGAVARSKKYWTCDDCGRDWNLNHCGKCDSYDLRKVVE